MEKPPNKAGWRGGGSAPPVVRPKSQWGWRQREDRHDSANRRNFLLRVKAGLVTFTALVLVGVVIWIIFTFPVKTPLIVAAITQYEVPIPPNSWAREDVNRFQSAWPVRAAHSPGFFRNLIELFRRDSSNVRVCDSPGQWTDQREALDSIEEQFNERGIHPGGPDKDVILFYISAHGILDDRGQPCLILATPPKLDPSASGLELSADRWLPIDKLLERIKKAMASRRDASNKDIKTVLLLDCNRFESCWELGVLYNDFAGRLEAVLKQAEMKNFAILVAAGSGQTGWASPELQGSLFGRYVLRGLQGAADGAVSGEPNKKVSLDELDKYVSDEVLRWSFENLHEVQKPLLFYSGGASPAKVNLAWAAEPFVEKTAVTNPAPAADEKRKLRARGCFPTRRAWTSSGKSTNV